MDWNRIALSLLPRAYGSGRDDRAPVRALISPSLQPVIDATWMDFLGRAEYVVGSSGSLVAAGIHTGVALTLPTNQWWLVGEVSLRVTVAGLTDETGHTFTVGRLAPSSVDTAALPTGHLAQPIKNLATARHGIFLGRFLPPGTTISGYMDIGLGTGGAGVIEARVIKITI